jgi:2-polyprenyl-3-methyl-5-hydroxy-6-metoxy-1,4-benzoquinol methylase
MKNGGQSEVISQFDRIACLPSHWGHNEQYLPLLLKAVPQGSSLALDVGCGAGFLTKQLSFISRKAVGLDVSPKMIAAAEKANSAANVEYKAAMAEDFLSASGASFDCIVSVAALHHMDEEEILLLMKNSLAPGGKILILDIVSDRTPIGILLSIAAAFLNPFLSLAHNGRLRPSKEHRAAWDGHFKHDKYLTIKDVRAISDKVFGKGNAKVRRLLFWRYFLEYQSNGS